MLPLSAAMKTAVYDLDKTLVRRATFTPFLIFASRRLAPWRITFLPLWVLMMAGYRIGLYNRTSLKQFGMRLMLGNPGHEILQLTGRAFASAHVERSGWLEGIVAMVEADRAEGRRIAIATAAFEFYATAFADMIGIEHVIATRWDGRLIPGGNCYGAEKYRRVAEWLGHDPAQSDLRFVSDSFADLPLLAAAKDAVFVTRNNAKRAKAAAQGWQVVDGEL